MSGQTFGALPFILVRWPRRFWRWLMAVPLALGVAVFLTELCPKPLRAPISFLTELLAAIPSVVYGLVGGVCAGADDTRQPMGPFLVKYLGWTGFFEDGTPTSAWGC